MVAYAGAPQTDPDLLGFATSVDVAFGSAADEIVIDTTNRVIALKIQGNLDEDGVTLKALYSAIKDAWQGDTGGSGGSNRLIRFPFPFTPITDEQFELRNGWTFDKTNTSGTASQTTEDLIRTGGWQVINAAGTTTEQWMSVITLGTLGTTDQVYYEKGYKDPSTSLVTPLDPINTVLTDIVNQGVQLFASTGSRTDISFNATGNVITTVGGDVAPFNVGDKIVVDTTSTTNDGTYTVSAVDTGAGTITVEEALSTENAATAGATTITADYRKYFKIFCREWQKTYAASSFEAIGIDTAVAGAGATFQAYRYPLANSTDVDIGTLEETTVATGGVGIVGNILAPYSNVTVDYLRASDGDLYVIKTDVASSTAYELGDVVYYPTDGNWYSVDADFTTIAGAVDPSSDTANFTLYEGQRTVGSANYPFTVIIDADTNVAGNVSGEQRLSTIYQSVQYQLRQNEDVDRGVSSPDGFVLGKTADELLGFVGPTLVTTEGVYIDSFNGQDNNEITLTTFSNVDGSAITVEFDFVAQITINFGDNLISDSDAKFFLFFANANGNAFGTSSAIIVNDAADVAISGDVSGLTSITRSFDYTGNTQGGRTPNTDAPVVGVGIGLQNGQYVNSSTTIERSTTNALSLIAALERNYTV
jgi:hypothetical protein